MGLAAIAVPPDSASVGSLLQIGDLHTGYTTAASMVTSMANWMIASKTTHKIVGLVSPGDVSYTGTDLQMSAYATSIRTLDNMIPYLNGTGNHDYSSGRTSYLDTYLSASVPWMTFRIANTPSAGSYYQVSLGGVPMLVIMLEWAPRDACVAWADTVLKAFVAANPTGIAVVCVHAYLYDDSTRYDWGAKGLAQDYNPHSYDDPSPGEGIWDGEELWGKAFTDQPLGLIKGNSCVKLVLCGHVLGTGRGNLVSTRPDGSKCCQVLFNTQSDSDASAGWIRRYKIDTAAKTITATTYSPSLNKFKTTAADSFTLSY